MSFTCNACHVNNTGVEAMDRHLVQSYGPCEDCGQTKACVNCRCDAYPPVNNPHPPAENPSSADAKTHTNS